MRDDDRTGSDAEVRTDRVGAQLSLPRIVALEHDATARALLADELDARYGRQYDVCTVGSNDEADALLRSAGDVDGDVALVLADRHDGLALLDATRSIEPRAKRVVLIGWNEHRTAREEIAELLVRRRADAYLSSPTAPRDERFHRAITELLDEWWRLRGRPLEPVQVIGDDRSSRTHEILDLLERHDFPHTFRDISSEAGAVALAAAHVTRSSSPVVIIDGHAPFIDPTNIEVAEALGAHTHPGDGTYDVVAVGGGPAGLAAAVSAGSEGMRVALVERTSMGGQAGMSSLIRNYLGFPRGISGAELATRAFDQAILFGTEMVYGGDVVDIREEDHLVVELSDGTTLATRSVVLATGVAYRTLGIPSLDTLNGRGVYYGSVQSEARALAGDHACVVGGGNSAGQAAMHLAQFAASVTLIVRSAALSASMSDYLVTAIASTPNIAVRLEAEVVEGGGDGRLEWIDILHRTTGATDRMVTGALFVLIGADPCTSWLPSAIQTDGPGYIVTGPHRDCSSREHGGHAPLLFETNMPGVFAVGDVRSGSVKRVASAAGEGTVCVRLIHDHLGTQHR